MWPLDSAILSQRLNLIDMPHPHSYFSGNYVTPPEQNYAIWEKELLATKAAFEV